MKYILHRDKVLNQPWQLESGEFSVKVWSQNTANPITTEISQSRWVFQFTFYQLQAITGLLLFFLCKSWCWLYSVFYVCPVFIHGGDRLPFHRVFMHRSPGHGEYPGYAYGLQWTVPTWAGQSFNTIQAQQTYILERRNIWILCNICMICVTWHF